MGPNPRSQCPRQPLGPGRPFTARGPAATQDKEAAQSSGPSEVWKEGCPRGQGARRGFGPGSLGEWPDWRGAREQDTLEAIRQQSSTPLPSAGLLQVLWHDRCPWPAAADGACDKDARPLSPTLHQRPSASGFRGPPCCRTTAGLQQARRTGREGQTRLCVKSLLQKSYQDVPRTLGKISRSMHDRGLTPLCYHELSPINPKTAAHLQIIQN